MQSKVQRFRGGGSAEQADYKEEEKVEFIGTKTRQREYKLLEDQGTLARQTPFWICSECGNMLYPKEDPKRKVLLRHCRVCLCVRCRNAHRRLGRRCR